MYSINPFRNPQIALSDTPTQETNKPIWLWLLLGIGGYFLLRKKKKTAQRESQTPVDLGGMGDYMYHYARYDDPVDVEYAKKQIQRALAKNVDKLEPTQIQSLITILRDEESRLIDYGFKGKSIMGNFLYTNIPYALNHLIAIYNKEKSTPKQQEQMTLFGELSGNLRTCDAWFEVEDKRGFKSHRCFFYKPTCNTKKCKKDPNVSRETNLEMQGIYDVFPEPTHILSLVNSVLHATTLKNMSHEERDDLYLELRKIENRWEYYAKNIETDYQNDKIKSNLKKAIGILSRYRQNQFTLFGQLSGYTATCLKWGKNRLGHKSCKKYAPTCGSAADGCRIEPAPIPGSAKEAKMIEKEKEIQVDAIAQELANEANVSLEQNKELMREILSYGGIAPHRGGFLREEYNELPGKYKRKNGIPLDELAQEMGTDETKITDEIYKAESTFAYLKSLRGGKTAKRFKAEDFINDAWDRLDTGKGFMGISSTKKPQYITTKSFDYLDKLGKVTAWEGKQPVVGFPAETYRYYPKYWKPALIEDFEKQLKSYTINPPVPGSVKDVRNKKELKDVKVWINDFIKGMSKKQMPEQTDFLEPSQMTLFGELGKIIPLYTTWDTWDRLDTGKGLSGLSNVDLDEIVYHGTHKKFDKFSLDVPIENPNPNEGLGIFFAKDPVIAMKYAYPGGSLVVADLELKRPLVVEDYEDLYKRFPLWTGFKTDPKYEERIGKKIRIELQKQGYDGVVFKHRPLGPGLSKMSGSWWIAFSTDSIKNMKATTVLPEWFDTKIPKLPRKQKIARKQIPEQAFIEPSQMALFGRIGKGKGFGGISGWVEDDKEKMSAMPIDRLTDEWQANANFVLRAEGGIKKAYEDYVNMKRGKLKDHLASAITHEQYIMNQRKDLAEYARKLIDKYWNGIESRKSKQLTLFGGLHG